MKRLWQENTSTSSSLQKETGVDIMIQSSTFKIAHWAQIWHGSLALLLPCHFSLLVPIIWLFLRHLLGILRLSNLLFIRWFLLFFFVFRTIEELLQIKCKMYSLRMECKWIFLNYFVVLCPTCWTLRETDGLWSVVKVQ